MGLAGAMTLGILGISTAAANAAASVGNAQQNAAAEGAKFAGAGGRDIATAEGSKIMEDAQHFANLRAIPNLTSLTNSLGDAQTQSTAQRAELARLMKAYTGGNVEAGNTLAAFDAASKIGQIEGFGGDAGNAQHATMINAATGNAYAQSITDPSKVGRVKGESEQGYANIVDGRAYEAGQFKGFNELGGIDGTNRIANALGMTPQEFATAKAAGNGTVTDKNGQTYTGWAIDKNGDFLLRKTSDASGEYYNESVIGANGNTVLSTNRAGTSFTDDNTRRRLSGTSSLIDHDVNTNNYGENLTNPLQAFQSGSDDPAKNLQVAWNSPDMQKAREMQQNALAGKQAAIQARQALGINRNIPGTQAYSDHNLAFKNALNAEKAAQLELDAANSSFENAKITSGYNAAETAFVSAMTKDIGTFIQSNTSDTDTFSHGFHLNFGMRGEAKIGPKGSPFSATAYVDFGKDQKWDWTDQNNKVTNQISTMVRDTTQELLKNGGDFSNTFGDISMTEHK
jgi:hypothetical protein